MKVFRWIVGVFLMVIYLGILYAGNFRVKTNAVGSNSNSFVVRIRGSNADTSRSYSYGKPFQSFTYALYDTSSSDSVAGTVNYQVLGAKAQWQTIKTLTFTSSDTSYWNITSSAIPPECPWRLVFTGGTGNKTGTDASPAHSCWEFEFHYGK